MITTWQAFIADLRLNSGRFGASILLCVLSLAAAAVLTDALTAVLPIWAALAWYRYGRADTLEREELRAGLGLSRADRVRGRSALIVVETIALIVTAGAATLLSTAVGREPVSGAGPTFTVSGAPSLSPLLVVPVGTLYSGTVMLLVAIFVGGECVTRRPGRGMLLTSLAVYFCAGLLGAVVIGPLMTFEVLGSGGGPSLIAAAAILVLAIVLLSLLLGRRVRAWIAQLDSGLPTHLAVTA